MDKDPTQGDVTRGCGYVLLWVFAGGLFGGGTFGLYGLAIGAVIGGTISIQAGEDPQRIAGGKAGAFVGALVMLVFMVSVFAMSWAGGRNPAAATMALNAAGVALTGAVYGLFVGTIVAGRFRIVGGAMVGALVWGGCTLTFVWLQSLRAAASVQVVSAPVAGAAIFCGAGLLAGAITARIAGRPTPVSRAELHASFPADRQREADRLADARERVAQAPEDAQAIGALGRELLAQGAVEEALPTIRRALALRANDADLHYDLARALNRTGAYAEAWDALQAAKRLGRAPDSALLNALRAHLPDHTL